MLVQGYHVIWTKKKWQETNRNQQQVVVDLIDLIACGACASMEAINPNEYARARAYVFVRR